MDKTNENEEYARRLARRAENGLKAIKILFIAIIVVAVATIVYAIVSFLAIDDMNARLIGFIVCAFAIVALFIAVLIAFGVAKINLIKLKKLDG